MTDNLERPDAVQPPRDDDVEGHAFKVHGVVADSDEAFKSGRIAEPDSSNRRLDGDDDVEAHAIRVKAQSDDDDVEGHAARGKA